MSGHAFAPFVGKASTPVRNEVERGAIRKFADAIGDANLLYRDEEYAATTRHGGIAAPPTFSRTFDYGSIDGFQLPLDGLIHGEQEFTYHRPILAGEVVYCSVRLDDVYERSGKLGTMTFLRFVHTVTDEHGSELVTQTSVIIHRSAPSSAVAAPAHKEAE